MLLNLDKKFIGLDDVEIGGDNIAKFLAVKICESTELEPEKFSEISKNLYKNDEVEIDSTDLSKIQKFVESNKSMILLLKSQILNSLEECRLRNLTKDVK